LSVKGKTVADSMATLTVQMMPHHANPIGFVHGGVIMEQIDDAAAVTARRHSGCLAVTACVDRLVFQEPVKVGELLILHARLLRVGRTSMDIEVRVESEEPRTGQINQVASAFVTFVAKDEKGVSTPVPPLILKTSEEEELCRMAAERRRYYQKLNGKKK
jgi:uncharacterized protein (TIGR00369 family)